MRYAINSIGQKVEVIETGQRAFCPGCGEEVISKCGDVNAHHWAHKGDSNCIHEPTTRWHLMWQDCYPSNQREVIYKDIRPEGEKIHKADIVTKDNIVLEVQHSPISKEDIESREKCYGDMVWILDIENYKVKPQIMGGVRKVESIIANAEIIYAQLKKEDKAHFSSLQDFILALQRSGSKEHFFLTEDSYRKSFFDYAKNPIVIDNKDKDKSLTYIHNQTDVYISELRATTGLDKDYKPTILLESIEIKPGRRVKIIAAKQFLEKYNGDPSKYGQVFKGESKSFQLSLFDRPNSLLLMDFYDKYKKNMTNANQYQLESQMSKMKYSNKQKRKVIEQAHRYFRIMNKNL